MTASATNPAGSSQQFRYGMGDTAAAAQTLARIRAYSRIAALRCARNRMGLTTSVTVRGIGRSRVRGRCDNVSPGS